MGRKRAFFANFFPMLQRGGEKYSSQFIVHSFEQSSSINAQLDDNENDDDDENE